jgi:hypothetical protein
MKAGCTGIFTGPASVGAPARDGVVSVRCESGSAQARSAGRRRPCARQQGCRGMPRQQQRAGPHAEGDDDAAAAATSHLPLAQSVAAEAGGRQGPGRGGLATPPRAPARSGGQEAAGGARGPDPEGARLR